MKAFSALQYNMKKVKHNKHTGILTGSGFTLIELIVVIAVLGILSAIAIPRFMKAGESARGARFLNDLRTIDTAIMLYQIKNGAFPTTLEDLVSTNPTAGNNAYLAARPIPPDGAFSVVQNNRITQEHYPLSDRYEIADGRAVYTSHGISNGTVDMYLDGGTNYGGGSQAYSFNKYLQEWFNKNTSTVLNNANKNLLFSDYYTSHPDAVAKMTEEERQKYTAAGLNRTVRGDLYWWTYPVTNGSGELLYTVTYANTKKTPSSWTSTNSNDRFQIGNGYVVQVNGKIYVRGPSGATVSPGGGNYYQTEDALEEGLKNNGYLLVE